MHVILIQQALQFPAALINLPVNLLFCLFSPKERKNIFWGQKANKKYRKVVLDRKDCIVFRLEVLLFTISQIWMTSMCTDHAIVIFRVFC